MVDGSDIAGKATLGAAGWLAKYGVDKAKDLVEKLRHGDLGFVTGKRNVNLIKGTRNLAEFRFYNTFDLGSNQRVLIQAGLALRRLTELGDQERVQQLRADVLEEYDEQGLHMAQCIQSGIPLEIHKRLLKTGLSEAELNQQMSNILQSIDHYVMFVQDQDDERRAARTAVGRINVHTPEIYVVAGSGTATEKVREIARYIRDNAVEYDPSHEEPENVLLVFFTRLG